MKAVGITQRLLSRAAALRHVPPFSESIFSLACRRFLNLVAIKLRFNSVPIPSQPGLQKVPSGLSH